MLDIKFCEMIFRKSEDNLHSFLVKTLKNSFNYKDVVSSKDNYIYAKGTSPYMLVAHLDTVHSKLCSTIVKKNVLITKGKVKYQDTFLSSPEGIGGDDRCGVILILAALLSDSRIRPSILFTHGEEVGGFGVRTFCKDYISLDNVNFFIEIDRRGSNDTVCYSDDNKELTKAIESFGYFKNAWGSFTDISVLMPHFKISGVNLSSGYYQAHTVSEYVSMVDMESILVNLLNLLKSSSFINTTYVYKEKTYQNYFNYKYSSLLEEPYKGNSSNKSGNQLRYILCDCCNDYVYGAGYEVEGVGTVCFKCKESLKSYYDMLECPNCGTIFEAEWNQDCCPVCGSVCEGEK